MFEDLSIGRHDLDQLQTLFLLLWTFKSHNDVQKLVLETLERDSVIDNQCFSHDFRSVKGVRQLRCEIETEVRVKFEFIVSKFNHLESSLNGEVSLKDGVQSGVKGLIHRFEQNDLSIFNGVFKRLEEDPGTFVDIEGTEIFFFFLLDPLESLELGIDTQGPSTGLCGQDTILHGEFITGEAFTGPSTNLHISGQQVF